MCFSNIKKKNTKIALSWNKNISRNSGICYNKFYRSINYVIEILRITAFILSTTMHFNFTVAEKEKIKINKNFPIVMLILN